MPFISQIVDETAPIDEVALLPGEPTIAVSM